jgi:transcriptional regulator with XRE-family HTH domain
VALGASDRQVRQIMADTPPTAEDLARAVRRLRIERRLTIDQLAQKAKMHPTYLSRIERGVNNPTWIKIGAIAGALDLTTTELAREIEAEQRDRTGDA